REAFYAAWENHVLKVYEAAKEKPDMDYGSLCGLYFNEINDLFLNVIDLGLPFFMLNLFFQEGRYFGDGSKLCVTNFEGVNPEDNALKIASRTLDQVRDMFAYLRGLKSYQPQTLADLRPYDWQRLGL